MALQAVHLNKILHRDIKSHNVFLMKDMQVKLGDFGVSRVLSSTKSRAATVIGTPYYYSPEMCKGETYDSKSDIWSLGVLLYEMCALEYPFKGKNYSSLIE
jgi:NIMA (never in mitosis gene a)-related kinase